MPWAGFRSSQKNGTPTGGAGPCRRGWARSTRLVPPDQLVKRFLRQSGGRRVPAHPVPSLATAPVCPACPGAVFSATGYRAEKPPREGLGQGLPRVGSKAQRPKTRFPVSSGQRLDLQVGITGSMPTCAPLSTHGGQREAANYMAIGSFYSGRREAHGAFVRAAMAMETAMSAMDFKDILVIRYTPTIAIF